MKCSSSLKLFPKKIKISWTCKAVLNPWNLMKVFRCPTTSRKPMMRIKQPVKFRGLAASKNPFIKGIFQCCTEITTFRLAKKKDSSFTERSKISGWLTSKREILTSKVQTRRSNTEELHLDLGRRWICQSRKGRTMRQEWAGTSCQAFGTGIDFHFACKFFNLLSFISFR